jgi:hypothetical protein
MTDSLWLMDGLALGVGLVALLVGLTLAHRYRELRTLLIDSGLLRPTTPEPTNDGTWLPTPGTTVPPNLTMTTKAGKVITSADFAGPDVVVVFLTSPCNACRAALPDLRRALAALPPDSPSPIAVLTGDNTAWPDYLVALSGLVRPIEEGDDIPKGTSVADALNVHSYPAVLVLGGGVVRRSGMTPDQQTATQARSTSTTNPPPSRGTATTRPS